MEKRETPATFTVKNTNDAFFESFRQAIIDLNLSNDATNEIKFEITGTGPFTIQPSVGLGALPQIIKKVNILGYSQAGSKVNTLSVSSGNDAVINIVLDGTNAFTGLVFGNGSAGSRVEGLSFVNCNGVGVSIQTDDIDVAGNYFGVFPNGTFQANGSTAPGVLIGSGNGSVVGDYTFTSNKGNQNLFAKLGVGVQISATGGANIQENRIGLGRGNGDNGGNTTGIRLDALITNATIKNVVIKDNLIGRNLTGIELRTSGPGATIKDSTISSNFIGTDAANSTTNLGNTGSGILINGTTTDITIGGVPTDPPADSNTIAFNNSGILLDGANVQRIGIGINSISNNFAPGIGLLNGANTGAISPILTQQAEPTTGNFTFNASINGATANTTYTIQFYSSNTSDSRSQGANFLGATKVTTDASGSATLTNFAPTDNKDKIGANFVVTSTLSNLLVGTSAFSAGPPATFDVDGGQNQGALVNQAFPSPLVVKVKDSRNDPVPGLGITFTAPATGASAFIGQNNSTTVTVGNSTSVPSPVVTANSTSGAFTVTASINGNTVLTPLNFNLTNYLTPTVVSINRSSGTTVSTSASFDVTFSETVLGVDASDFVAVKTGTVNNGTISISGSGKSYTVTVPGITGNGSLGLDLADNSSSIRSPAGTPLYPANAKTSFFNQATFAVGTQPITVALGDFNADGKLDIVNVNEGTNNASVLLGNGDGTFANQLTFALGSSPRSVALGDVNADGKLDLVTGSRNSNNVSVLLGNGNGTFATQTTFAVGTDPEGVSLGDVNGDGKLDIVTANRDSDNTSVLLGNGNGSFGGQITFALGDGPYSVSLGDVNGDGKLDIVTANTFSNNSSVLLGNGNATFATQNTFAVGNTPKSVKLGDVNSDGKLDIVTANNGSDTASVLLGNGDGTFGAQTTFSVGDGPWTAALGDVNGDGKVDLVIVNRNSYTVSVLLGNGNGTFSSQSTLAAGKASISVAMGDVSGDGRLDIVTANLLNSNTSVLLNALNGNFTGQIYTVAQPAAKLAIATTIAGAASGSPFTIQPVIIIQDAGGETVTTSTAGVTIAVSGGDNKATLFGTTTVNAVTGTASFSGVGINGTAGQTYILTFTSTGLTSISQNITASLGPAKMLLTGTNASGAVIGQSFTQQPVIVITDSGGNTVTSSSASVAMSVGGGDGKGVLFGMTTVFAVNGIVKFSGVGINGTAGQNYLLTFTSAGLTPATQNITPSGYPNVVSINRSSGTTVSTSANFDVTFSEAVLGVDAGDFAVIKTGTVNNGTITVTGTGASYTVTVPGITGNGSLGLNLVDNATIRTPAGTPLYPVNAPASFSVLETFAVGTTPYYVASGDVNGDGKLDLVTANTFANSASVLLGNGNGTFANQTTFAVGNGPNFIAFGDVNGDNKLDIVTANSNSANVSVLLGNGNGTFANQTTFAVGLTPAGVAVGDFNGDGKVDIATANSGTTTASVLLGNGNGTFAAETTFAVGNSPRSVSLGDVNGDGKLDIVAANFGSNTASVLLGNGNGTFATQTTFASGLSPSPVTLGDVNSDGKLDIVTSNYFSHNASVLLGNGNGTFATQQIFATSNAPRTLSLGDVNGDGKLDIVTAASNGSTASVLLGNGNGTFGNQTTFSVGAQPFSITTGDFNGDGRLDFAAGNAGPSTTSVLLNALNGNFTGQIYTVAQPATKVVIATAAGGAASGSPFTIHPVIIIQDAGGETVTTSTAGVTIAVSGGDGKATIFGTTTVNAVNGIAAFTNVGINGTAGTTYTLTFTSTGLTSTTQNITATFGTATHVSLDTSAAGATIGQVFNTQPVLAIRDSFGNIVTNSAAGVTMSVSGGDNQATLFGTTTVLAVNGLVKFSGVGINGTAGQTYTLTFSSAALTAATQNITPSGYPTVVSINRVSGTTVATSADFNVTFSETVTGVDFEDFAVIKTGTVNNGTISITGTGSNYTVTVPGITGNGSLGLNLVDNASIRTPAGTPLYPANAPASFGAQATFGAGNIPVSVTLGDVNGDGKLDIVTANQNSDNASVLLGNGNGTFGTQSSFAVGKTPSSVTLGDVNGDGKLDIIASNGGNNTVSILLGNGNGTFATQTTSTVGDSPAAVSLGDVNGDGKLDIVTANAGSTTVSVLLGNGNGTFATQTTSTVGDSPRSVSLGDVNGDGKLDLAIANGAYGSKNGSVLLGNGNGTFATQVTFATGILPRSVTLGDVNGDGKLDIVIGNSAYGYQHASVLLGNGNGTFATQQTFATGNAPRVTLGDVNGDGKLDIVTANQNNRNASVLLGNGNGTFISQTTFDVGTYPVSVTLGDVNGDGRLDIVTANSGPNTASVLLNTLNGNFTGQIYEVAQPATKVANATQAAGAASGSPFGAQPAISIQDAAGDTVISSTAGVTIAVSGGDNKASLFGTKTVNAVNGIATFSGVGINGTAGQTYTLTFTSTGLTSTTQNITATFGAATHVSLDTSAAGATIGQVFNTQPVLAIRDSFGNIVTNSAAGVTMSVSGGDNQATLFGTTTVLAVNGLVKFSGVGINGTAGQTYTLTFSSTGLTAATQSILTFGYPNVVSINRASGTTVATSADFNVTFSENVLGVDAGDFAVIKTGTVNNGTISISGNGANYTVTVPGISGNGSLGLNLVDNGSIRSLVGTPLYPVNAPASFGAQATFAVGTGPASVSLGDVNGDANLDLVTANFFSNTASVLLGDGKGTFGNQSAFPTGAGPESVTLGDVNSDGFLDIVTGNNAVNNVSVLLGNGIGFGTQINFTVGNRPRSVTLGDVNGDGKLDIVTANFDSDNASVLLGIGDGTFANQLNFALGDGPLAVALGDVNGDGKLDLVTGNQYTNNTSVLLGNGNGSFGTQTTFAVGDGTFSVSLGDVNADGKLDIVAPNDGDDTVSVLLGNGNGSFANQITFAVGDGPFSTSLGDVNGDGKLDIVTANYFGANASVLLGNGNGAFGNQTTLAMGTNPRSVSLGDFNKDGRLDFAIANFSSKNASVLLNALNGNFTGQVYTVAQPTTATKVGIAIAATGATIGLPFNTQPEITIQDAAGVIVTTSNVAVTMSVSGGDNKATLFGTTTAFAVNGIVKFAGVGINGTAGQTYTLSFSSTGLTAATQNIAAFGYPTVVSINRASGTTVSTSADFNVTFSEAVNGVDAADFAVIKTGTVNNGTVTVTGTGFNYTVTVPGITGNGSLGLNLFDNGTIKSPAGTPLYPVNAPPSFLNQATFAVGTRPNSVAFGDVNKDGNPDIVTANSFSNNTSVLLGDGKGTFGAQTTFAVGTSPSYVILGDVNADTNIDIIIANQSSNNVSILLGNGNGAFGAQSTIAVGYGPSSVSLGDVNGDGKLDIVTANGGNNNASVLLGNGNGSFANLSLLAVGNGPASVTLGDANGDGKLDIVTANGGSDNASVLLGNGNGTFGTETTFAVGNSPRSVTLGDVNGDGKIDIVTANSYSGSTIFNSGVSVLLGNGNGTFATLQTFSVDLGSRSVSLGDVNGDGKLDIVTANAFEPFFGGNSVNNASVLLGNGNGTFASQIAFSTGKAPVSAGVGDFNGDGRLDLATANSGDNNTSVLLNALNGDFTGQIYEVAQPVTATKVAISSGAAGATIGLPFNIQPKILIQDAAGVTVNTSNVPVRMTVSGGDNKATLFGTTTVNAVNGIVKFAGVGINGTAGQSYTLTFSSPGLSSTNQSIPTFGYPTVVSINRASGTTVSTSADFNVTFSETVTGVDAGDFAVIKTGSVNNGTISVTGTGKNYTVTVPGITGDGSLGLNLVDNGSIGTPVGTPLYPANAPASFSAQTTFGPFDSRVFSVVLGDVNGDSNLDIVTADIDLNSASVLLGTGNGTFGLPTTFAVGISPNSVTLGDVNGDGNLDIVTANSESNNTSVLLGDGKGLFGPQSNFDVGKFPRSVALGDVNGDGKLDIVTANQYSNSASVLLGNGTGNFAPQTTFAVGDNPFSVALGDFNSDGKLDIVTANLIDNNTSVLLGNGNGSFGAQTTFAVGNNPRSVALGDVNADGRLDIVTANFDSNSASVLLGNGNGIFTTFAPQATFAVGNSPISISLGDVNGDGKLDIATANFKSNTASVLLGKGTGTFGAQTTFAVGNAPLTLNLGDVNGDGRLDFGTANSDPVTASVLLNALNGNFTGQVYTVAQPAVKVAIATPAAGAASGAAFTTQPVLQIQDSSGRIVTSSTAAVTIKVSGGDNRASLFGTTTVNAVNGVAAFSGVGITGTAGQSYILTYANAVGITPATQNIVLQSSGPITLTAAATTLNFVVGAAETRTLAFFTGPAGVPINAYSAIINWGDNTPNTRGAILPPPTAGAAFGINGTHAYALPGTFVITVAVSSSAGSPDASTTISAGVLTQRQQDNLGSSQNSSLPPNQVASKDALGGVKIIYAQPPTNTAPVDFFLATFVANPQITEPTAPPESFFDIRVGNPSLDGKLSISFNFDLGIGQGSPYVQFSQNEGADSSTPYLNVLSSNQFVIINYVTNTITVILDQTSFPKITNLKGTVFTVVQSPSAVSPNTVTIVPGSFSPNLVTMILPSGLSGTEMLSTPTSLTFQSTVTSSLTLAPLQSSTRALVLSSNYGGTNENPPDSRAMTWQDYLKTIVRGTLGKLPEVVGQTLLKVFQAEDLPLLNWWNQLMGNPPKPPVGVINPQQEEVQDPPALEALIDPVFEELELLWTKPEVLEPFEEPTADKITAPEGISSFSGSGSPVTMGVAAFSASYLLEAYRKQSETPSVKKPKKAKK